MEPIEIELKNALTRTDPIPTAELAALKEHVVQAFARKQQAVSRLLSAYLAGMTIILLVLLALFLTTTDLKQCLLYGIGVLILFEGTVLMKLWYWIMHGKIATVREIKMLQLSIVELKTRPFSEPPGTASSSWAGKAPALPLEPPTPAARQFWRSILVPVWLLAAASLVYFAWLQNPHEPRDLTPYFEQKVEASPGVADKEWQQTFDVVKPRQRFYPRLESAGKQARVWIAVSAEGREPMYTGPVESGSRISFGRATAGRYVIKARTEQADGVLTLGIYGVDEIPGHPSFGRLFLLMLSAALVFAIPLVRLQNRWLRQIDPELQR